MKLLGSCTHGHCQVSNLLGKSSIQTEEQLNIVKNLSHDSQFQLKTQLQDIQTSQYNRSIPTPEEASDFVQ